MELERDLRRMAQCPHDILVIGGGINGTAVARDAALRGLRVALVEKEDFGYGTTSRSTRLAHGGLRYLETFDFGLVREGLRERQILLDTAPHLVKPLPFITPVYNGDRVGVTKLRLGMILYDALAWGKRLPNHTFLTRNEALAKEPGLSGEGLRAAMMYYDAQISSPERLSLENVIQAVEAGAQVANHAEVRGLLVDGRDVRGVRLQDRLDGSEHEIRAEIVVNAGGPWVDRLNKGLASSLSTPRLRLTKGIHLVVPRICRHAIVLLARRDGRLFFAIPWLDDLTLIGTTDTDFSGDLDTIQAERDEIAYLLAETRRVFPSLQQDEVYCTTAGVRPLVLARGQSAGKTSRKHKIHDHVQEGVHGLVSVLGGKITNQRHVAEEVVDLIVRKTGRKSGPSLTARTAFPGVVTESHEAWEERLLADFSGTRGLGEAGVRSLIGRYGARAEEVLKLVARRPELAEPIQDGTRMIAAEVVHAVQREMARSTCDVLLRRTTIGLTPGQGRTAAPRVATQIGAILGWKEGQVRSDVESYLATVDRMAGGDAASVTDTLAHDRDSG